MNDFIIAFQYKQIYFYNYLIANQMNARQNEQPGDTNQEIADNGITIEQRKFQMQYAALKYLTSNTLKNEIYEGSKVYVQTDVRFVRCIDNICRKKKNMILDIISLKNNQLTDVQCQKIHFLGLLHRDSNVINQLTKYSEDHLRLNQSLKVYYCQCGCNRLKGSPFPLRCNIQEINVLGSSMVVYFMLIKHLVYAFLLFLIIFGVFSIAINLIGRENPNLKLQPCQSAYCSFRNQASASNMHDSNSMMRIEGYLGLSGMIILIVYMRWIKHLGTLKDKSIDKNLISSSDYTIKINNLPYGQYNEEELLEYLQKLGNKIKKTEQKISNTTQNNQKSQIQMIPQRKDRNKSADKDKDMTFYHFSFDQSRTKPQINVSDDIKSIQIIYNMKFSRQLIIKLENSCMEINNHITRENQTFIIKNKEEYMQEKKQLIQLYQLFEDLRKKFFNDGRFRKNMSTRTAIVQFNSEESKNKVLKYYGKQKISIFKALKLKILDKCFGSNSQLIFKGNIPQIIRAPEPSDLLWQNCEQKESLTRVFIIYMVTFSIILVSFGLILGIQYIQIHFVSLLFNSSNVQTVLNIVISVFLQIINKVLWFSLFYLLDLEYNHTSTNKIISQMHKTSFLMWINIILLPIFVEYFLSNSYFGANGLSGIVFDYHISALTIGLIVKFIDPMNFVIRSCLSIKCIRNYLIKIKYKKIGNEDFPNKAMMTNIYSLYQEAQFNIAESYVFIISNILHAFFFCSLQPFILVLALFQVFFFYWICKVRILRVCKIPSMTQFSIFEVSVYQLMLIPVFYGTGRIFHSYVYSLMDSSKEVQYYIGAICIAIGLMNYFNPGNIIHQLLLTFFNCFQCQSIVVTSKINTQSSTQEEEIQHRMQDYFKKSNSLTLLGFQKYIKGEINLSEIENELKRFCYNCIPKNNISLNDQFQALGNLYDSTDHIKNDQHHKEMSVLTYFP